MKTTTIGDHESCVEMVSGSFRIAVTTQVGPRIICASVDGGRNMFADFGMSPEFTLPTGWRLYGGHRLMHAPESIPRSYEPDNGPVRVRKRPRRAVEFAVPPEVGTGIEKRLTIRPLRGQRFEVVHTLFNRNTRALELAPWALSVMAPGGRAILPMGRNPKADAFQVNFSLNLWPYAQLDDPRLVIGHEYIQVKQRRGAADAIKIGITSGAGWAAYVNRSTAFVKYTQPLDSAAVPDRGSNLEVYSAGNLLELETLGVLSSLATGRYIRHVEVWHAFGGVGGVTTETGIRKNLVPRLIFPKW